MNKSEHDLDITKNIKIIENLKAKLLSHTAELFTALAGNPQNTAKRSEILADVIITSWLLSGRLGISNAQLSQKIRTRLRTAVVEGEGTDFYSDLSALLRHMEGKNQA